MEALKIAVCDNNKSEYDRILELIRSFKIPMDCEYYSDGRTFLDVFFASRYDLVLLDIPVKGSDAIRTAEELRRRDPAVPIAFLSAGANHMQDGYRLHIDRYLQKPLRKEPLRELCELAAARAANSPALLLKIDGKDTRLPYDSIVYIEQSGHTVFFHMISGEILKRTGSLTDLADRLPDHFLHCHKSYLVNMLHVTALDDELHCFTMRSGDLAYIRRSSLKDAKRIMMR